MHVTLRYDNGTFPVGFPVEVSALNSLLINMFRDGIARKECKWVIIAKQVLLVC